MVAMFVMPPRVQRTDVIQPSAIMLLLPHFATSPADPINQHDDGSIGQHKDSREGRRRQSLAEKAILFYQYGISPLKPGPSCRFEPTCSNYALTAIRRYGVVRGVLMAAIRLSKCGPWHPGGWDPVPPRRTPRERVHDAHVHDDKDHREGTTDTAGGRNNRQ